MTLLREAIKSISFDEFIESKFENFFSLKKLDKNNIYSIHGELANKAFYVLDGRLKLFYYFSDEREFNWEFEVGNWIGLENVVTNLDYDFDIEAVTDTLILEVPLKKLLDEHENIEFYKKIMALMAEYIIFQGTKASLIINYSGEELFMKHLTLNDYSIEDKYIWEIASTLKLNLRTFHRILKKLIDLGIIQKEGRKIFVKDLKRYESHLRELEISEEV